MQVPSHDGTEPLRFKVQGSLSGSCVEELASAWDTVCSEGSSRAVVVDLTEITAIDGPGRQLMVRMCRAGAQVLGTLMVGEPRLPRDAGQPAEDACVGRLRRLPGRAVSEWTLDARR